MSGKTARKRECVTTASLRWSVLELRHFVRERALGCLATSSSSTTNCSRNHYLSAVRSDCSSTEGLILERTREAGRHSRLASHQPEGLAFHVASNNRPSQLCFDIAVFYGVFFNPSTYGHSQLKTGHPVRSAIHKQLNGRLVLRWVTTWESLLLYVLHLFCSNSLYHTEPLSMREAQQD